MSISYEQAMGVLSSGESTVDSLFNLVRSVSGAVEGATSQTTYLLNSGDMPNGQSTASVVGELQAKGSAVSAGNSEAGKLLNDPKFLGALRDAVKLELFGDADFNPIAQEEFNAINARENLLLNGKLGTGAFDPREIALGSDTINCGELILLVSDPKIFSPILDSVEYLFH
jgi:hypothetical protein